MIPQKNFEKKLFSSTGLFMDWKLQTEYAAFNGGVHFICFRLDISFLDNLGPKNRNCQFKLRFVTTTNSNMQNSMALFTFSVSDRKQPFWVNLVQKNWTCQFKLKFGNRTNLNMQNSMVMFNFSILDWKNLFWANFVQKIKIVNLSGNLVPRLIRITRIQWQCSLFLF